MARIARRLIASEYWHVMLRGIGHMDLFMDDYDRSKFLSVLKKYTNEYSVPIYAFCLMDNHVHLLLKAQTEDLSVLFKKIEVSYSYYYKVKYEHVGHVFQNRFLSEPIKDSQYLLAAARYILRNPEAAGICSWMEYRWSSAREYCDPEIKGITETSFICGILGGAEAIIPFVSHGMECQLCEPKNKPNILSDPDARKILYHFFKCEDPLTLKAMSIEERNKILAEMKAEGLSVRQIERLTGINRNVIQRAK